MYRRGLEVQSAFQMLPNLKQWLLVYQENKWLQYRKKVQCWGSKPAPLEETKAEADKCKLNPKIFVAPSIGISKNYNKGFMTL